MPARHRAAKLDSFLLDLFGRSRAYSSFPATPLTGADRADLDAVPRAMPRLAKPFGSEAVEGMVRQLLGTVAPGRSVEQGEPARR